LVFPFLLSVLNRETFSQEEEITDIQPLDMLPGSFISRIFLQLELLPIEVSNIKNICTVTPGDAAEIRKNQEGDIEAATFEQLIIYITSSNTPKESLLDVIIRTFISFTSPKLLFAALVARYFTNPLARRSNVKDSQAQAVVRHRVIYFLTKWVNTAGMEIPDQVLDTMETLNNLVSPGPSVSSEKNMHDTLGNAIQRVKVQKSKMRVRNMSELHIEGLIGLNSTLTVFLETEYRTLAEQMTLQNSNIFRNVQSNDITLVISGKIQAKESKTFFDLQDHFDKLSRFVSFSIVYDPDIKAKVKAYTKWIKQLYVFKELNDYVALFAVILGITHSSVSRLSKMLMEAWQCLSQEDKNLFEELKALTSFTSNFNNYRKQLAVTKRPCIPFLGCFQKDWVYFQETRKKENSDTMISVNSLNKCYDLLMQVQKYQSDTYAIKEDEATQKFLYNLPELPDSTQLMKISMIHEPK
jgi:son of sevenless-like protein